MTANSPKAVSGMLVRYRPTGQNGASMGVRRR